MRKFPAVLLPLPLGEVASRSDDGEGEPVLHHDMRLSGAVGAQQLRQPDAGVQVALRAFADKMPLTAKGHHVRFAEGLTLVRGVQHHLYGGHAAQPQRVQNGYAVMGVAARVQHNAVHPPGGRLDLVNQIALVVGLADIRFNAKLVAARLHIVHQAGVVHLARHAGLRPARQIDVWPVKNQKFHPVPPVQLPASRPACRC